MGSSRLTRRQSLSWKASWTPRARKRTTTSATGVKKGTVLEQESPPFLAVLLMCTHLAPPAGAFDANSGHQILLPTANWFPVFALGLA